MSVIFKKKIFFALTAKGKKKRRIKIGILFCEKKKKKRKLIDKMISLLNKKMHWKLCAPVLTGREKNFFERDRG